MSTFLLSSLLATSVLASNGFLEIPLTAITNRESGVLPRITGPRSAPVDSVDRLGRRSLSRRSTPEGSLQNEFVQYLANIAVGTPGQNVQIALDTGSSDLWVMSSSNPYCFKSGPPGLYPNCSEPIVFDASQSSTYQNDTDAPFYIQYGDYTYASGTYFQDTLSFAGVDLTNATMALADIANSSSTVFGIGFPSLEAMGNTVVNGTIVPTYPNAPQLFKSQGYINSVIYSLWLNDANAPTGSILFGGIDHSKYEGTLTLLPILNLSSRLNHPYSMHVRLDGITVSGGAALSDCPLVDLHYPALLDSGTSYAYLPPGTAASIAGFLNFTYNQTTNYYMGNCQFPETAPSNLNFHFGGSSVNISIPLTEFSLVYDDSEPDVCALIISDSADPYNTILGDVFLRWVYAVFDLDNYQVALAPTKVNVTESDIEVASSNIPAATSASDYETAFQTTYSTVPYANCPIRAVASSSSIISSSASSTLSSSSASSTISSTFTSVPVSSTINSTTVPNSSGYSYTNVSSAAPTHSSVSETVLTSSVAAPSSYDPGATTVTTVVSEFTTYCPEPTTFSTNGQTYTVTEATTLTITDCPCTIIHTKTQPNTPASSALIEKPEPNPPLNPSAKSVGPSPSNSATESGPVVSTPPYNPPERSGSPSVGPKESSASNSVAPEVSSVPHSVVSASNVSPSVVPGVSSSPPPVAIPTESQPSVAPVNGVGRMFASGTLALFAALLVLA